MNRAEAQARARELTRSGHDDRSAAARLTREGYPTSKSTIARWRADGPRAAPAVPPGTRPAPEDRGAPVAHRPAERRYDRPERLLYFPEGVDAGASRGEDYARAVVFACFDELADLALAFGFMLNAAEARLLARTLLESAMGQIGAESGTRGGP
jgi:hypothetical protein